MSKVYSIKTITPIVETEELTRLEVAVWGTDELFHYDFEKRSEAEEFARFVFANECIEIISPEEHNMTRLEKLIEFIEEKLEVDYGYMPRTQLVDENKVDEYIQGIKDEFEQLRKDGQFADSALNESISVLEGLNDI